MSSTLAKPASGKAASTLLDRVLSIEIVRVTERAAVAAARLRGRGNEKDADQAAVDAMRRELNKLPIEGTIVIGEGERDEAPMLFIGEKVGKKNGPAVDIAVDRPGTFAAIARLLADEKISLESIMQRHRGARPHGGDDPKSPDAPAPVILITYATSEDAVRRALKAIRKQGVIADDPQVIRIEKN